MFQSLLNLRYNWQQNSKEEISAKELLEANITILGQKIKNTIPGEKKREQIQQVYSTTLWFTYRKNFPPIQNSSCTSDAGWGCMLRSGQMIWAQILRVHLRSQKQVRKDYQYKLLCAFADDDDEEHKRIFVQEQPLCLSPYSIQKIEIVTQLKFKQKPCQWYKPDQILHALQMLHQSKPIQGGEDLAFVISDNLLYDKLFCEMYGLKQDCEHILEKLKADRKTEISKICSQCPKQPAKALGIFLLSRIGMDSINKQYLQFLNELIDLPQFQGIIGGKDDKAYYIIGRMNNKLIYLDPHLIQEHYNRGNVVIMKDTFFCKTVKYINEESISPSIGIGFYCQNQQELDSFFHSLEDLKKKIDKDSIFAYINRITPNSLIIGYDESEIIMLKDDEF